MKKQGMELFEGVLAQWQVDRNDGIDWEPLPELPDPAQSALWSFYQECAKVTPPTYWTLDGAPSGSKSQPLAIPRLVEPVAYYTEALEQYDKLSIQTPADDLIFSAAHITIGLLSMEMATEKMKYTFNEGYELMCHGLTASTGRMPKPLGLILRWLGGVGIIGVSTQHFIEVRGVVLLIAELLESGLDKSIKSELTGFARNLVGRALAAQERQTQTFFKNRLMEVLPSGSPVKSMLLGT